MQSDKTRAASSSEGSNHPTRLRACMNCRRRKRRCDTNKPICGQCSASSGLNRTITRLQTRIQELESLATGIPSVQLDYASESGQSPSHHGPPLLQNVHLSTEFDDPLVAEALMPGELPHTDGSGTKTVVHASGLASPSGNASTIDGYREEPPLIMIKMLVDNFLPHASEFGFFLDIPRFREAALLPYTSGHFLRPSPALLSTVYLWGVHLSRSEPFIAREHVFLSLALQHTAATLSSTHPHKILHGIQAEVLLCQYMFRTGNLLEGRHHASIAVSLSIGSGIHRIGAQLSSPEPGPLDAGSDILPTIGAVEEGERINAFWTVLILNNCWTTSLSSPVTIPFEAYGAQEDTPWPKDMESYEQDLLLPSPGGGSTVQNFLNDVPTNTPGEYSTTAMLAKASILYERAAHLATQCLPDRQPDKVNTLAADLGSLDTLIDNFRKTLPPINQPAHTIPSSIRTVVVTHTLAHVATIELHKNLTCDYARQKRLSAAKAAIDIVGKVNLDEFLYINTIMGALWATACRVLMDEISRLRSVLETESFSGQVEDLVAALERGFAAMAMFSLDCPLMSYQLTNIQEAYLAIA